MNIEILEDEKLKIPDRFQGIIFDEIHRVLSNPKNNKEMDTKVIGVSISYALRSHDHGTHIPCDIENAKFINIKVRFQRIDHILSSARSVGHLGLQIPISKTIKKRRGRVIDNILDNQ
jgi:hypothetical protein